MSTSKRSAGTAECAKRCAKTRAIDEAQPRTGQPPPQLPSLPSGSEMMTCLIDGHEVEWRRFFRCIAEFNDEDGQFVNESLRRRVLRAEHAMAPPDDAKPLELADLIRYDAEYEPPGTDGAELWQKYDDKCAGCNNMDKSWDKWDKRRYGSIEPRWRRRGTRQFVCWRCYEQVEQGTLTALRYHK